MRASVRLFELCWFSCIHFCIHECYVIIFKYVCVCVRDGDCVYFIHFKLSRSKPILDFLGPDSKLCRLGGGGGGGGGGGHEWNTFVCVSLHLDSRSRKALEKQCLFRGSLCFQLVVLVSSRDFTTSTLHDLTDFYVERATALHYNKYHSCFHSRWSNSNTKLKWNHLWEQDSLRILHLGRIASEVDKST